MVSCLWVDKFDVSGGYKYVRVTVHDRIIHMAFHFALDCIEFEELTLDIAGDVCDEAKPFPWLERKSAYFIEWYIEERQIVCLPLNRRFHEQTDESHNARQLRHGISEVIKGQLGGGP